MSIFINSIKGLGIKHNVRPQKSAGPDGDSNSVISHSRRSGRGDEPFARDSGPAVRLDISSNGRDIHERIRRAYDLGSGRDDPHNPPAASTESMAPTIENLNFRQGQLVEVSAPAHLVGKRLSVVQYMPARLGAGTVVCTDEAGVSMAFAPGELRILG
jgi:hypothetical protein